VSLRHQNWIVDVDRATGDVRWILGDGGDFTLADGAEGPAEWFYSQHAPTMESDGTILVYDNGNERPDAPDSYSRAVRYLLDEDAMTATQVWSYPVEHYTIFLGDAVSLEDGGALVCAGGVLGTEPPADVLEVQADPLAPVRWRVSYGAKTVVYRAKRIASFYPQE
ncbi:MAG: aryl-sulfate sulfotransferase, partial [Nannocystaceae bacterium]